MSVSGWCRSLASMRFVSNSQSVTRFMHFFLNADNSTKSLLGVVFTPLVSLEILAPHTWNCSYSLNFWSFVV